MAGGQGEGRDDEPGFAPAVFAVYLVSLRWLAGRWKGAKELRREKGAKKCSFQNH